MSNTVSVIIPHEMLTRAKELGINISAACRDAVQKKIVEVETARKVQP